MSDLNKLANNLQKYLTESDGRKPKPYDTKAEVLRIEGDTAWVKIPGGIDETPVQRTNNANPGDTVVVRVSGGRAWIAGNNTSPATDDARANAAFDVGTAAGIAADAAIGEANRAREAADYATGEAVRAQTAADEADDHAEQAGQSAQEAKDYAGTAFNQLAVVENIVGVLNLIADHGEYAEAVESEIQPDKWYFKKTKDGRYEAVNNPESIYYLTEDIRIDTDKNYYVRSGSGTPEDPYVYTMVENPDISELPTYYEKYYVLINIDDAIQNYVSSHLVLMGDSLYLRSSSGSQIELSSQEGVILYGEEGQKVGVYGSTSMIGDEHGMHISIELNSDNMMEIGFWQSDTIQTGYISGGKLYIGQAEFSEDIKIGKWFLRKHVVNGMTNFGIKFGD